MKKSLKNKENFIKEWEGFTKGMELKDAALDEMLERDSREAYRKRQERKKKGAELYKKYGKSINADANHPIIQEISSMRTK